MKRMTCCEADVGNWEEPFVHFIEEDHIEIDETDIDGREKREKQKT